MHRRGNDRWAWLARESGDGISHEGVNKDENGLGRETLVGEESVTNMAESFLSGVAGPR